MSEVNRREFIKGAAVAGTGVIVGAKSGWAKNPPSERIRFACVGIGGKGGSENGLVRFYVHGPSLIYYPGSPRQSALKVSIEEADAFSKELKEKNLKYILDVTNPGKEYTLGGKILDNWKESNLIIQRAAGKDWKVYALK